MSTRHPVIAVTGSSGAGTTTVMKAFAHIFRREGIKAEVIEGEPEYQVERILDERRKRVGRGYRHEYLVKWVGHERPTWNPAVYMEDTEALEAWISLQQREGEGG